MPVAHNVSDERVECRKVQTELPEVEIHEPSAWDLLGHS